MKASKIIQSLLLLIVFLTGGSLLVIEVAAMRILSPYYGNTIFTFSSVISIVLAALSAGYYFGGKYADKHPHLQHFFCIILLSGLTTLFANALAVTLLPSLAYAFSIIVGPLVWATLLFTVPSVFLGMLSPFVIKLEQEYSKNEGIGSLSGKVFFWSTLGSISGSLMAGFLLIPHIGLQETMTGVSLFLVTIGLAGFLYTPGTKGPKLLWIGVSIFVMIQCSLIIQLKPVPEGFITSYDGMYEKIVVIDKQYKERNTRFLLQDRNLSSAEFMDGDGIPFDYAKYYQLHSIFLDNVETALVIGAGAYTVPRLLWNDTQAQVDVVDIEPKLKAISEQYFKLDKNIPLNHYFTDGRRFLHDTQTTYDVIFNDAYGSNLAVPTHLTTLEFFALVKQKLTSDGIFIGNFIGSLAAEPRSFLLSEIKTFKQIFPNSAFFAVRDPQKDTLQNVIFLGMNGKEPFNSCDKQYRESENPLIASLCAHKINLSDEQLAQHIILTDNYAPTEYLTAQSLSFMNQE